MVEAFCSNCIKTAFFKIKTCTRCDKYFITCNECGKNAQVSDGGCSLDHQ